VFETAVTAHWELHYTNVCYYAGLFRRPGEHGRADTKIMI